MELDRELKKRLGEKLQENVPLKEYNCLGVGGDASFFYEANSIDELLLAITTACSLELPYFILGGGNNTLPSDLGYEGLVIKNNTININFSSSSSEVIVDSGVDLTTLINIAASRDLGGLEFLSGFAGTIGGAIKGNFHNDAYSINDFVKAATFAYKHNNELVVVNIDARRIDFNSKTFGIRAASHNYPPVILTARMQLVRRRKDEILKLICQHWQSRQHIQSNDKLLVDIFKENSSDGGTLKLLERVGAKKMQSGGAGISRRYVNSVVNNRNATASDVRNLVERLREAVFRKYGVLLQERIEYFGEW